MRSILIIADYFGYQDASNLIIKEYLSFFRDNNLKVKIYSVNPLTIEDNTYNVPFYFNLNIRKSNFLSLFYRIDKLFTIIFNTSIDLILFNKQRLIYDLNKSDNFTPKHVIHFVSGNTTFTSFLVANELIKKYKVKYYIHFFDPKPGLSNWGENKYFIHSSLKIMSQHILSADKVSAISSEMLSILNTYYNLNKKYISILSIPINDHINQLSFKPNSNKIKILYFGSVYGKRDITPFFKSIAKLITLDYDISVDFVGYNDNLNIILNKFPSLTSRISFYNWINNLSDIINDYDLLLDLNADIPNDPFISSKIFTYLGFSKPILSICSHTSSSFIFASQFESTYTCENNSQIIFETLVKIFKSEHYFNQRKIQIFNFRNSLLMEKYMSDVN